MEFYRSPETNNRDDAIFAFNGHTLLAYSWEELSPTVACLTYGENVEG